jgi:uncharacterized protein YdeI (YjbR/CyaY-like superfamily)
MVTESSNLSLSAKQEKLYMAQEKLIAEIRAALTSNARASLNWDTLPPSHRRQYVKWISEAKKEATRRRRIAQMLEMVANR